MRVGYIRVSTEEQNLARQEQTMKDLHVEKIFSEKASGKNTDRAEFRKMMDFVHEGDTVIVASLDRLGRNYDDIMTTLNTLREEDVKLEIVDAPFLNFDTGDEALDKAMFTMFTSLFSYIAQNERKKILERQKQGITEAKKRGVYKGRPTRYHENAKGADKIVYDKIIDDLAQGRAVSRIANETGVTRKTVYRIKRQIES
jgi:DNA invertase Pin-like site-specific DNA recombinase